MPVTDRGRRWELINSLWVLFPLTLYLGFMAFLFIGTRAKRRKWLYWALFYALAPVLLIVGALISPENASYLPGDIMFGVSTAIGLGCIVHAFAIRPEYLRAIDFLDSGGVPSAGPGSAAPSGRSVEATPAGDVTGDEAGREVDRSATDVNSADLWSLSSLPGMDPSLAKKAVALREKRGGFSSVEEFFEALGLKPHQVARLQPHVVCVTDEGPESPPGPGRRVDY
ncbi:MAG: helix-hairpin-helix domain-containing protein [Actinomycetota bacterium]